MARLRFVGGKEIQRLYCDRGFMLMNLVITPRLRTYVRLK